MEDIVRKAIVSGIYYPNTSQELESEIQELLKRAQTPKVDGVVRAIVIPHASYVKGGHIMAEGFRLMSRVPQRAPVIIVGPSHFADVQGAFESPYTHWQTPLGTIRAHAYSSLARDLHGVINVALEAHQNEFSIEVVLPFLQVLGVEDILPLSVGRIDPKTFAQTLLPLVARNAFVVVSTDLSHYRSRDEAMEKDYETHKSILSLDSAAVHRSSDACGKIGLVALITLARTFGWEPRFLGYDISERDDGEGVIGHGAYAFFDHYPRT